MDDDDKVEEIDVDKSDSEEEKDKNGRTVGLDFGTYSTSIGLFDNGFVNMLEINLSNKPVPCYVSFDTSSQTFNVGDIAKQVDSNAVFAFKKFIGITNETAEKETQRYPFK